MTNHRGISVRISDIKCCVIIPTYNNEKTIKRVIDGVLDYTNHIIVVNDGCTDSTPSIIAKYPDITLIHFEYNRGKGMALRKGFEKAIELGYAFAITIDSDGQHYPNDIPVFINEIEKDKNALIIGSRNMTHDSVPKKSSFGNKFSNFWFWSETGVKMTDTQSGYRLYPLERMDEMRFFTSKFEFEIESIVRASWKGVKIKNVPVKVLYDPEERVTHFRPIKDFARISVLNSILVVIALFYIKPRDLYRKARRKGLKRFFLDDVMQSADSPKKKALSIALGLFVGLTPFWGFHTILALSLAVFFKLNKAIAFAFSNISIPPMIPFIVLGGIQLGNWILGTESHIDLKNFSENLKLLTDIKEYLVGSFVLASIVALFIGGLSYVMLKIFEKEKWTKN